MGDVRLWRCSVQTRKTHCVLSAFARFGRKWDLEIVVEEGGEISTETGLTTPRLSGWFIGRNDLVNHPATTVRVRATKDKNHLFKTRLRVVDASKR